MSIQQIVSAGTYRSKSTLDYSALKRFLLTHHWKKLRTLQEAIASRFSLQQTSAIFEEPGSIDKYGTYAIEPRPRDRKAVGSRFASNLKTPEPLFKVHLAAKGDADSCQLQRYLPSSC